MEDVNRISVDQHFYPEIFSIAMAFKIVFGVLAIAACVFAMPQWGDEGHHDHHAPAHYKFEYSVHDGHTGDVKSASESRDGDVVKGYYKLKDADGTTREVHYTADKHSGFNAIVTKSGHHESWGHGHQAGSLAPPKHEFHVHHPHGDSKQSYHQLHH